MEVSYKKIEAEYLPNAEDDDLMRELKEAVFNELTEPERKLLILYAELGSFAAVSRLLRSSPPTAKRVITEIIDKIK